VELGIESASGGGGSQPLTVNLYRNSGSPFPGGSLTVLGSAGVVVADQTLTMVSVPVAATVAKGGQLVVEILVPDGTAAHNLFFIGSNPAAESGPSYVRAPACGVATPVPMGDPAWGFPGMHIVLTVDGVAVSVPAPALDRLGLLGCVLLLLAVAAVGLRRREKEASMMNRMGDMVGRGARRTQGRLPLLACALGVAAGAALWAGAAHAVPVVCNAAGVAALGTCNSNYATCTTSLNTCTGNLATCTSSLATCNAGTATAADVLSGKTFSSSSGLGLTGSVPAGSNVGGANGLKTFTIPDGLYSGSKTATANDSNLAAGNIVTGVSIFGVTGTYAQLCGNGIIDGSESCDQNNLNGKTCVTQGFAGGTLQCAANCVFDTSGCYAARFVDNGNGTVTDNQTKLIWEKKDQQSGGIHNWGTIYTWGSTTAPYPPSGTAYTVFLAALNGGGGPNTCFAGQCDWRLPSLAELQTIVDGTTANPATFSAFNTSCAANCTVDGAGGTTQCSCTQSFYYWSATTTAGNPSYAWYVTFDFGNALNLGKTDGFYVRAVRGGL
jgi:hypothetical protein